MRKRILFIFTALTLVAAMIVPSMALAGAQIQDDGSGTVSLDSEGDAPEQANGTAKFDLDTNDDGWHKVRMELKVSNLPERAGQVFETWLRDSEADFDNPVGAFQTDNDGDGGFTVSWRSNFFAPFDEILVTSEERNDTDPKLSGEVLLRGTLD